MSEHPNSEVRRSFSRSKKKNQRKGKIRVESWWVLISEIGTHGYCQWICFDNSPEFVIVALPSIVSCFRVSSFGSSSFCSRDRAETTEGMTYAAEFSGFLDSRCTCWWPFDWHGSCSLRAKVFYWSSLRASLYSYSRLPEIPRPIRKESCRS